MKKLISVIILTISSLSWAGGWVKGTWIGPIYMQDGTFWKINIQDKNRSGALTYEIKYNADGTVKMQGLVLHNCLNDTYSVDGGQNWSPVVPDSEGAILQAAICTK